MSGWLDIPEEEESFTFFVKGSSSSGSARNGHTKIICSAKDLVEHMISAGYSPAEIQDYLDDLS